jgi:glycosyltransferase involved in cell wall biosynthesis
MVDENKLVDAFQRFNTSENIEVQMLGVKLGIDKWQLLSDSDILILPSHSEDLPISVIEAICLGKPVIATKVGSLADLVEEGVNGILVEPKDTAKLRAAIEMLVSDKLLRDRMSEAALSLSRKYNFDKYLEDLNKIYQSCD